MATRTKRAQEARARALAKQLLEQDPDLFDVLLRLMERLSTVPKKTSIELTKGVDADP